MSEQPPHGGDFVRWELHSVAGAPPRAPNAQEIDAIRARAHREGFDQGHAEGLAAGRDTLEQRSARLDQLLHALTAPFEALDETVEQELVALVIAIARQLVRRELRTDRGQIIAVIREALAVLPMAAREVRVHLHPEDAELVRELLAGRTEARQWQLVEDPILQRGDCRVSSANSQVDARRETRLGAIVSAMLGGERDSDESGAHDNDAART